MDRRRFFLLSLAGSAALMANEALALKYYPAQSDKSWAALRMSST